MAQRSGAKRILANLEKIATEQGQLSVGELFLASKVQITQEQIETLRNGGCIEIKSGSFRETFSTKDFKTLNDLDQVNNIKQLVKVVSIVKLREWVKWRKRK